MSNKSIFIITGKPQSGKTYLAKSIAEHLSIKFGKSISNLSNPADYQIDAANIRHQSSILIFDDINTPERCADIVEKCFNRPFYSPVIIVISAKFEDIDPFLPAGKSFIERVQVYETYVTGDMGFKFNII